MIALFWLSLLIFFGSRLRKKLIPDLMDLLYPKGSLHLQAPDFPKVFFNFPASLLLGTVPASTLLFFITTACSHNKLYVMGSPLLAGLLLTAVLIVLSLGMLEAKTIGRFSLKKMRFFLKQQLHQIQKHEVKFDFRRNWSVWACLFFLALMVYLLFSFVFYTKDGVIYSGSSVVSDYGPHLANISAFVRGDNYAPTDYPVFTGAGMRYHFFFFFFAASLHALGLSLTLALNLVSALGLLAFSMLMGVLAVYFSKRKSALFWIQPLLYFQSSFAWFSYFKETLQLAKENKLSVFLLLLDNRQFIGRQTHDEWGLWNMNVYANQRHLLFGLAVALLIIILFFPSLHERKDRFSTVWFTRDAWLPHKAMSWKLFSAAALLLVCLPYWHGAVTIALLLLLFAMAIPARNKLLYLSAAALTLGATIFYSDIFAGGTQNVVTWRYHFGFLNEDLSFFGIAQYLTVLLGPAFFALLILPFCMKGRIRKSLSFALWLPLVFAMTISLTPDINVNHKYIIISRLLLCLPIVTVLMGLFNGFEGAKKKLRRLFARSLTLLLAFLLMLSGIVDLIAYINKNQEPYALETESPFTIWLEQNTEQRSIFVTPTWFYHSFFYSGRQAWYGYPYYAWSAGYDSIQREQEYNALWSGFNNDFEYFKIFINRERLAFAIIDQDMRLNKEVLNEDFFIRHFPVLHEFNGSEALTVYDLRPFLKN